MFYDPGCSVKAGAEFLDRVRPGWDRIINLGELDMSGHEECMIGQLYGTWNRGVRRLELNNSATVTLGFQALQALKKDFDADATIDMAEYDELTRLWTALITERRSARESEPMKIAA